MIEECGSERENKAASGVEGWTGEKTEDERERKSRCKEEEKKGRSGDEEEASAGDEIFFPLALPLPRAREKKRVVVVGGSGRRPARHYYYWAETGLPEKGRTGRRQPKLGRPGFPAWTCSFLP